MGTKMKRRDFLAKSTVGFAGLAATSALATPAIASGVRELKMVTAWPKNFPGLGTGAQRIADHITNMSDGKIKVNFFSAGELVPALQSFDAVASGTADLYHGAAYYWQGKSKALNFFSAAPFGLTASELNAWIYFGGGQELWDEVCAQFGVKAFLAGNTGSQMGGWYKREIKTIDDYKGFKVRMPGLGGEVLRRLGAAVVNLPAGEIYQSLQSGAIDGVEWVGPWNDLALGVYQVAKFYHYPGFHEPGTSLDLGVNLGTWETLSSSEQLIVESAARAENAYMLAEYAANNAFTLQTLLSEHDIKLVRFPDAVLAEIGKVAVDVVREVAESDPLATKVYNSFVDFRDKVKPWTQIAELAGLQARELSSEYPKI